MGREIMMKAMKLLVAVVFVGWVFLWVMMPTNIYKNVWSTKIRADTSSTYFGRQGTNMLMLTFPILFIAVVGCIYLHRMKKSANNNEISERSSKRLQAWKKPLIVKGPLGIISAMEFSFCLMFLALIVWTLSVYITNSFARITKESSEEEGHQLWQLKLETVGLRFGLVGNICCAFLFFPVTRGSSLLPLIGLTSESAIKYHVWLGHIVMLLFTSHGLCYVIYWISTGQASQMTQWATDDISNLAGEIALLSGLIMWVTTFPRIRRKMFELFFYTHHLYVVFLVFFLLHVGISFFCYILPGIYLFMIDRFLRFLQSRRRVRLVSARLLPSEAVELNFSKSPGLGYTALSTVFINVPSVSSIQWHPFTVSSSSGLEPGKISVIVKKEGSWTQKLYQELNRTSIGHLAVSVEGPYGPASVNFLEHDSLVMVSGGSGLTPFISIIRELIHLSTNSKTPVPKLLLICCFKTSVDLTMLDLLLPISSSVSDLSKLQLSIQAFVTREQSPTAVNLDKSIRTIWFKPDITDLPVSPVLGPNSYLWLAAIIVSSFVSYLVVIGIMTRYYIYPIQNSGDNFSITSTTLLNLLFLSVCIVAVSSAAVVSNKKKSMMESKQVLGTNEVTPGSSPSNWFCDGDRELESLPNESIQMVRNVDFGRRPDLKKMFSEVEGASVSVMASGPSGLRREVAAICASKEAENLHFESISFNW